MTPQRASHTGQSDREEDAGAVSFRVENLKKRADFLRAARAARVATPGFIVQMRRRAAHEPSGVRVGFTCSKKVGNAVARNRAKRRLREVARLVLPTDGREGMDYVLVGRAGVTATRPFPQLLADFRRALQQLHDGRGK